MSYQVLARKWRPKKFQDVIGQVHVTRSLQNAIANKKIGHAYMMVGTRGVGKTSVARIFAKAIRCENITSDINACGICAACLDFDTDTSMNIIEIDGASNNSVDNIRDLISNVHYLPTSGEYKVYIIDEVHMLSTNAFNALLKTLEEPPAHVVFIFATTEAQKLLGTVLSRCQRFDFRNVPVETLVSHVKEIAKVEDIKFEQDELIAQLATLGRGSVRDTLSLLDQVLTFSDGNFIKEETLTNSLGVAGPKTIQRLKEAMFNGHNQEMSQIFNKLLSENVEAKNILSSLLDEVYKEIIGTNSLAHSELIWIYETMARETKWIFDSITPDKASEVLLHKIALRRSFFETPVAFEKKEKVENVNAEAAVAPAAAVAPVAQEAQAPETLKSILEETFADLENMTLDQPNVEVPQEIKTVVETAPVTTNKDLTWDGFLGHLYTVAPATASNLEQGNIISPVRIDNGKLSVEIGFNFSGEVFIEYLQETDVFQKLMKNISNYFEVAPIDITLSFTKVDNHDDFISSADLKEQIAENNHLEKIEEFKKNPLLVEAEKIFNSKIDKVVIKNNN